METLTYRPPETEKREYRRETFGPQEDIDREVIVKRKISEHDFNSADILTTDFLLQTKHFVTESLTQNRYDSFPLADWLQNNVDEARDLHHLDDEQVYGETGGGTCVQMARHLNRFYTERGLKSHFVPFETMGQINGAGHEYNPYGHLACLVPFSDEQGKKFLLIDQGLALTKPIIFPAGQNSSVYRVGEKQYQVKFNPDASDNPYVLEMSERQGSEYKKVDEASFDPFSAMENPVAFTPEVLRVLPGFRTTKYDEAGHAIASASVDYRKNSLKLKYTLDGKTTSKRLSWNENLLTHSSEISQVAKQLGISQSELLHKLKSGKQARGVMTEQVLAPSVRRELSSDQHEKATGGHCELAEKVIGELNRGELFFHEHTYNIKVNDGRTTSRESRPTPFGESIPTLEIADQLAFDQAIFELLEFTSNHENLFWVKSRLTQTTEQTAKDVLAQIWFNATPEDFRQPVEFIRRQIQFLEDSTLADLLVEKQIIGSSFKNCRLETAAVEQSGSNETPYMLNFTFKDEAGNRSPLPSIRCAIQNGERDKIAYIYAVQAPKVRDEQLANLALGKKMNRYLYKINDGVAANESQEYLEYQQKRSDGTLTGSEFYPENISDVSVSSVLSLASCLKLLQERGVRSVKVPYFCPLRFQAHARLGIAEQYRIQDNTSNKFLRTFRRVAFHFPMVQIGENKPDGYTHVDLIAPLASDNQVLKNIL